MSEGELIRILVIVGLLLFSAFFSASETAFSSMNRAKLRAMAEHGSKRAEETLKLAERYDDLLTAILIGNNIVNIAMSSIGTLLFIALLGSTGATVSTVVITVVVLVFGEVTPKCMAKEMPERFAMKVTPVIKALMTLFFPLCKLFSLLKKQLNKLFSVGEERGVTHDELITLVEEAEQEGGMDKEESALVRSAIVFGGRDVSGILTPRVYVEGVEKDFSADEIEKVFLRTGYSRLPVYEETLDKIIGVIHEKDFYRVRAEDKQVNAERIMTSPVFVPESSPLDDLMHLMQRSKAQMAVVTDEYGGTAGIVTMEDILEELVGDIWDEHDEIEETVRSIGENEWLVQGDADVTRLEACLDMSIETDSSSVGGWVMEELEHVPDPGESFIKDIWKVTVREADERRVILVMIQKNESEPADREP